MSAKFTLFAMAVMFASPLAANSPQDDAAEQVAVAYADLDLDTASGRHALNSRLRAAVRSICAVDTGLASYMISRPCVAEASVRTNKQLAELISRDRTSRGASRQVAAR